MQSNQGKWEDLRSRIVSAGVLVCIGGLAVWLGGAVFSVLCLCALGAMIWELTQMHGKERTPLAIVGGGVVALVLGAVLWTDLPRGLLPLVAALVVLAQAIKRLDIFAVWSALYAAALSWAVLGLVLLRAETGGLMLVVWLILVVVASDVLGYFAGRTLGGPKFWPAVSPKKTWSGTVAGWVGAALVGFGFVVSGYGFGALVVFSVVTAFAAQMGDIAESALKRRAGVKDSSNLIPGHGGLLDRFDGLAAAGLLAFLMTEATGSIFA